MANAVLGKVLLIPKGDYSAEATYVMLDMVRYNNRSWVCKQTCTGQTPQEDSYWQLMASDGSDGVDGVSMNLAGEWVSGTAYTNNSAKIDIVSKSGCSYGCLQNHTSSSTNQPPNSSYWQLLAQKGEDGQGAGDMLAATYDPTHSGSVVDSNKLGGNLPTYYQQATKDLTAETALDNADTVPFYDASTSANRKFNLGNIKAFLKPYFDTLYNNYTLPTASSSTKGGIKTGDGLSMTDEVLSADVKGLISSENDFNAQTVSTSQAVDSYLAKKIITDIAGSGIAHNSIYRGKNLGASVTSEQYAAISAGTFGDLFIGDYWTIGGVNYRIAAFDYYWNCGDTPLTAHHAVIVPEKNLYNAVMNTTDTTTGGYIGSQMYTTNLAQAKTTIKAAFSGHVVNHRIFLVNAVANGYSSGGAWVDSEVDLMNEQMVYGSGIFSPASTGSVVPVNSRVERTQLPLFAMNPAMLNTGETYWLRDVITASGFAYVNFNGRAYYGSASSSFGVRPAFCIS